MRYYKVIENDIITGVGVGDGGTEITEEEYSNIISVIKAKTILPGYEYHLKTDLTWEESKATEPEPESEEILNILLGGAE